MRRSYSVRKQHVRLNYEPGDNIGAELEADHRGRLCVQEVTADSTADQAGLIPGAVLVEANGVNVRGKSASTVAELIRSMSGTRHLMFSLTT